MIDTHCHLEHERYDEDREEVIGELGEDLEAVVTVSTSPNNFERALRIKRDHEGFVFLAAGLHPLYTEDVGEEERSELFESIREHRDELVALGETGLDFYWVKDDKARELQMERFREDLELARRLDLPAVVHSRDAPRETVRILEEDGYDRVHWHLFKRDERIDKVLDNGWMISVGPLIHTSEAVREIVREVPMEQLMLETDSPWWGGKDEDGEPRRGTPLNIRPVAEEIAEIKEMGFREAWRELGRNAIDFYSLGITL